MGERFHLGWGVDVSKSVRGWLERGVGKCLGGVWVVLGGSLLAGVSEWGGWLGLVVWWTD